MSTATAITGRALLGPALFDKLTQRVTNDHGLDPAYAARIVDQTGAFLKACADNPDTALTPSMAVDLGWHALVLHTADYATFCQTIAGRFIHHEPTDEPGDGSNEARATLNATIHAIRRSGMTVDLDLWGAAADCSQCHAGCHDSPKQG
jgi:hypothetical protein